MIKEQSFEWLLEGCHRIADVAVAYYPNYAYACSAVKALRRSIAEHACLLKDLTDQGYTARTAHLTPVQIGILLSYWGMPDHVKDMTVKNPYLLVSKKYVWGIERSGFFNGREKWAKGFENQMV